MLRQLLMSQWTRIVELVGKQTDYEKGTHHDLPSLLNLLITGDAEICPAECIFG